MRRVKKDVNETFARAASENDRILPGLSDADNAKFWEAIGAIAHDIESNDSVGEELPNSLIELLSRISKAALKGGGSLVDVSVLGFIMGARAARFDSIRPLAIARQKQLAALKQKKTAISDEFKASVLNLNASLLLKFPKATPRYRAIAEKMNTKVDRVRYAAEGPRRAIKKK